MLRNYSKYKRTKICGADIGDTDEHIHSNIFNNILRCFDYCG